jgi:3-hydroxyisobutyrate dehydrogenase-like beta-hydroxyacid dehydrogenase
VGLGTVVGFVGLGAMGGPMAANLAHAGFEVAAFDVDPTRVHEPLQRCDSVTQVCDRAGGLVVSIVRTLPETEAVAAEVRRRGVLLVVMSTINPTAMARLAGELAERGVEVLDAPVSGGVAGAEAGSLAIMAAGAPSALERARPVLDVLGRTVFQVGERPGEAQAVKLANQLMLAVNMLGAYEGIKLARAHGLSPERVLPVIEQSTGASWAAANWDTVRQWWEGAPSGGALDIVMKDLRSLLADASERYEPLPMAALAFNLLREVGW